MAQWFYAEGPNRNVGPLNEQEMSDAFRRGVLLPDSQVWREGMAQWQPLRQVAAELGLQASLAGPPPLPGTPPPLPAGAQYTARPAYAGSAHARQPSSNGNGMSRGAVIALVCVGAGVAMVMVLGILAAIAVPAYSDYTVKAKVAAAISSGGALRPSIEAQLAGNLGCPSNDTAGFKAPDDYADQYVASITVGEFDDGTCGMEVRTRGIRANQIDGRAIWITLDPASRQWSCNSDLDDRWLPASCKG